MARASESWEPRSKYVIRMFGRIAHRYDLVNTVISLGQDKRWRDATAAIAAAGGREAGVDIATGSGEMALALAKRVQQVVAIDFCPAMLAQAQGKMRRNGLANSVHLIQANALSLPLPDNHFDCATMGFALRNLDDLPSALAEIRRVLKPGGRFACLELTTPSRAAVAVPYRFFLHHIVPLMGYSIIRSRESYDYLAYSVAKFPPPQELRCIMEEAGLDKVEYKLLAAGTVAIHLGIKT